MKDIEAKYGRRNPILSFLTVIAIAVLTITFSIGLPIYVRPFYYVQIDILDMPENTGFEKADIKEAYDEVLDFLTLPGREFGTGKLSYSEEGKGHFEDCKVLFDLNRNAFLVALAFLVVMFILSKLGLIKLTRPLGCPLKMYAGITTLTAFSVIGALAAADFDRAFVIFHQIFFPGKDNWLFDPYADEIINVMPEEFFMSCGILICLSILVISVILIVSGVRRKRDKESDARMFARPERI